MSEGKKIGIGWIKWIGVILIGMIACGMFVKSWRQSQVVGHRQYRFNMATIVPDKGVTFVSFDPSEKVILTIPFPANLEIQSRSSGDYAISSLYKLGAYNGAGGMFARQKIQGFMRVPVPGFIVMKEYKSSVKKSLRAGLFNVIFGKSDTSLTKLDAVYLLFRTSKFSFREVNEDQLLRAAVIEPIGESKKYRYHADRLQEFVGTRLFDWGIGAENVSVAIINSSGENGLGSDMADFLSNLGIDVVMVRSTENELLDKSEWQVSDAGKAKEIGYIFQNLFSLSMPKIEQVPEEYRASVVLKVGKDAINLF